MFQLLQPIWLFALAGLCVPVIIHLWNRRPGKILNVGSIALVKENVLAYKRKIKLSDLLLLLLRCLLLAFIAIALAGPLWRSPQVNTSKGWVLMNRQKLPVTYNRFMIQVDSLLQAGFEFHYFEEGFQQEKLQNALQLQTDSNNTTQTSYRRIAALLNAQVDSKLPLYIFTDNYLRNFSGKRNAVSLNLHWFTYTPDTIAEKFLADTAALQMTIYSKAYTNDARYVKAAIDAIQQFSKKNITTRVTNDAQNIPAQQDWLFWLDDEVPKNIKDAKNIFQYAKGETVKRTSYILPAGKKYFAAVDLYKSIGEKDSATKLFTAQWQDGYGKPLLVVHQQNKANWYYLYTHIDPAWNELPWNDNFPAMLYKLLYANAGEEEYKNFHNKTVIGNSQLMPVLQSSAEAAIKPAIFKETKLAMLFWLITFILFFAERALSFYNQKENTNG